MILSSIQCHEAQLVISAPKVWVLLNTSNSVTMIRPHHREKNNACRFRAVRLWDFQGRSLRWLLRIYLSFPLCFQSCRAFRRITNTDNLSTFFESYHTQITHSRIEAFYTDLGLDYFLLKQLEWVMLKGLPFLNSPQFCFTVYNDISIIYFLRLSCYSHSLKNCIGWNEWVQYESSILGSIFQNEKNCRFSFTCLKWNTYSRWSQN